LHGCRNLIAVSSSSIDWSRRNRNCENCCNPFAILKTISNSKQEFSRKAKKQVFYTEYRQIASMYLQNNIFKACYMYSSISTDILPRINSWGSSRFQGSFQPLLHHSCSFQWYTAGCARTPTTPIPLPCDSGIWRYLFFISV